MTERIGCTNCNTPLLYQDEIDRGLCPSCHVKTYQYRVIAPALFAGTYTSEQEFIDAVRTPMAYANPNGITHTHVIDDLHIHTYSNGLTEMALKFYYERAK